MASFGFDHSQPPSDADIKDVALSAQEREFLLFLFYQWGSEYVPNDEQWIEWTESIYKKLG